ncbi:hypothetical protein HKX39_10550 [Pelistega suis]|uniref:Uncharacterized protein n=2 Tax=Pelistega suis TaxID=1631957 RepID=A0A849PAS6_9BURK|nr:hypothetical protein [Pelistega suis]
MFENFQGELLNNLMNLQPLPKELNSSKGKKVETGTDGWKMYVKEGKEISPEYRRWLAGQQRTIEEKVKEEIKQRGL